MRLIATALCIAASAAAQGPLTRAFSARYEEIKRNLIATAEVMPERDCAFRLTPEQRPFGEWIAHTAAMNFRMCAAIRGTAAPDTAYLGGFKEKAQLVRALNDSFGYCDESIKGLDDQKALREVDAGGRKTHPVDVMFALIAGGSDHYGNLVGYLRSKGIVPPSTARGRGPQTRH